MNKITPLLFGIGWIFMLVFFWKATNEILDLSETIRLIGYFLCGLLGMNLGMQLNKSD